MNLLEDIINELVDNKVPLSSPLLKTKVLATRIENQPLLLWVHNELTGYQKSDDLPTYRKYVGSVFGSYLNGNWKFTNQALPIMDLPEDIQDHYVKFEFLESVETLDSLKGDSQGVLSTSFSAEQIGLLQHYLVMKGNPYLQIIAAHKQLPANTVTQILSVVRSQLLDFVLEIEKAFGSEVDIKTLKEKNKEVVTIMNQTINNSGDGNIINTGSSSTVSGHIKVIKNDIESLVQALRDQKVPDEDIESLTQIINTEKPKNSKTFGAKVQGWINKMLSKSLDGTWEIGIAAAGGVLAEIIKDYYGI